MKRLHVTWMLGGMAMTAVLAACSNDVRIVPEPAGTTGGSGVKVQIHGIRLPVFKGQSLCALYGLSNAAAATVLGFRPY